MRDPMPGRLALDYTRLLRVPAVAYPSNPISVGRDVPARLVLESVAGAERTTIAVRTTGLMVVAANRQVRTFDGPALEGSLVVDAATDVVSIRVDAPATLESGDGTRLVIEPAGPWPLRLVRHIPEPPSRARACHGTLEVAAAVRRVAVAAPDQTLAHVMVRGRIHARLDEDHQTIRLGYLHQDGITGVRSEPELRVTDSSVPSWPLRGDQVSFDVVIEVVPGSGRILVARDQDDDGVE